MNGIGTFLTLLSVVAVLTLPRRFAVLGVLTAVCYITQGQMVDVGGFHFTAIRIVLLAGFVRTLARGELRRLKLTSIDWIVIAYALFSFVVTSLRIGLWQEQAGTAYNVLLSYFVFRCLITDWVDVQELLPRLALLILPLAACMIMESTTGRSVFMAMGGQEPDNMREGHYRCLGSFRGCHCAGTFGATLVPLFVGAFFASRQRMAAAAGLVAATVITYTANSSGPLMAYLSGLVGLTFWPLRKSMKAVRWGIVVTLVGLALVMKAPIWYVFCRISDITGGNGWDRSYLLEQCFNHVSDWWLMGTSNTSDWGSTTTVWGGADLTNQYVACAAEAGLGSLVLFVLFLIRGFQGLGLAMKESRELFPESEILLWTMGCALFAHVVTFFSLTYFDQMHVAWWALLAMISSATSRILEGKSAANELEDSPNEYQDSDTMSPQRV